LFVADHRLAFCIPKVINQLARFKLKLALPVVTSVALMSLAFYRY